MQPIVISSPHVATTVPPAFIQAYRCCCGMLPWATRYPLLNHYSKVDALSWAMMKEPLEQWCTGV